MNKFKMLLSCIGLRKPLEDTWENMAFSWKVRVWSIRLAILTIVLSSLWDVYRIYFDKVLLAPVAGLIINIACAIWLHRETQKPIIEFDFEGEK